MKYVLREAKEDLTAIPGHLYLSEDTLYLCCTLPSSGFALIAMDDGNHYSKDTEDPFGGDSFLFKDVTNYYAIVPNELINL